MYRILDHAKGNIDGQLFLYQGSEPSTVYRYAGFFAGLEVMHEFGVAGKTYYLGDGSENGNLYGLVNIAGEFYTPSSFPSLMYYFIARFLIQFDSTR